MEQGLIWHTMDEKPDTNYDVLLLETTKSGTYAQIGFWDGCEWRLWLAHRVEKASELHYVPAYWAEIIKPDGKKLV